jgi:L-serine deaminase
MIKERIFYVSNFITENYTMNRLLKHITAGALGCLFAATAIAAAPKQLITHNTTDLESNAFIDGTIPSTHPTKAHSDGKVFWTAVKMACFGHIIGGKCSAVIKMATNTAAPVVVGMVSMDLETGEITPKQVSGNGYKITVNGPGETTLSVE